MRDVPRIPSLSKSEFLTLTEILADFEAAAIGPWMIVGSLSYGIFAPSAKTEPGLRDVDLAVFPEPGQDPRTLVSPNIKRRFWVQHIREAQEGYYFSLRHKSTSRLVDVFTRPAEPHDWVNLDGLPVRVATAEGTLSHGILHLLMLDAQSLPIDKKTPYNVKALWKVVDQQTVLSYFEPGSSARRKLPCELRHVPAEELVERALAVRHRRAPMRASRRAPPVTTINGISVSRNTRPAEALKASVREQVRHKLFRLRMTVGV